MGEKELSGVLGWSIKTGLGVELEEGRKLCQLHRVQDSVLYHIINQSSSQLEKWPLARNPTQLNLQKSLHKMTPWALHPARLVPGDSFICFSSSV